MQPLIRIETVPISIEYVEKQAPKPSINSALLHISQNEENISIKSNPIRLPLTDSFEFNSSSNTMNMSYTATANYAGNGNLNMNVQLFEDFPSDAPFQQFGRDIESMIEVLPEEVRTSSKTNRLRIDFNLSSINKELTTGGFPNMENFDTSFMPPVLELKVVELPRVIIKYVGGPIYIPKSSDPDYVPPKEINQIFDGKSNLDVKA